jgi:hypothetical protein
MKITLLTLALVAAAGVASAQTASTPATGAAGATMNNSTITNGNTGMQGAQMGVGTQAQTNSNVQSPATGQMNSNMNASGAAGASADPSLANAPSQEPLTGAARTAQKRIEQDGYKSVQNIQRGSDGLWHGTAMRGNTQVQVTVDRSGRVSAQ